MTIYHSRIFDRLHLVPRVAALAFSVTGCFESTPGGADTDDTGATNTGATDTTSSDGGDDQGGTTDSDGTDTGDMPCPPGTPIQCGNSCVDTQSNHMHCGQCDHSCAMDELCDAGTCALGCSQGTTECSGSCVDTDTNPTHCGDCDASCTTGWSCESGNCVDPRQWGTPQLVETDDEPDAHRPQLALYGNGNAIVVWELDEPVDDGALQNIWANRYDAAATLWGTPERIEMDDAGRTSRPQVVADDAGNAIAVWYHSDGMRGNAVTNRYDSVDAAWQTVEPLEALDGTIGFTRIAMDDAGNAIAVWSQEQGTYRNIRASRYDVASGSWGSSKLVEKEDNGDAANPQIAAGANGDMLVVWEQFGGAYDNIRANWYGAGAGRWLTAINLETQDYNAYAPQVAVDANNNAVVVWHQELGDEQNIWSRRYDGTDNRWGVSKAIENIDGTARNPQVAIDPNGNAIAVWVKEDASNQNIWSNRYDASRGAWGTAQLIQANNTGRAHAPRVAVDDYGNAVVAWAQRDGDRGDIWANRYGAHGDTWQTAELVEADDSGRAVDVQVAIDDAGNATAIWVLRSEEVGHVWVNRLQP